ncbi:hypothetical protein R1flu_028549 [Riccia fluitans]|uniref:Uncharacterized protein n=1 Tax=Riccia fluitans TaxID=41844 RepID=A0ABD1XPV2_9MARC
MEAEEGVMEAEGGVPEPEAGNIEGEEGIMEAEGGVTEVEAGNMEAEKGVTEAKKGITEAKAKNMEAKEGVTKVDGGVMEVDLEEATEAEGGVTEPHLEEVADRERGVMEAKEVAREMECVAGHNIFHQLRSIGHFETCKMEEWKTDWDFRNLVVLPTGWQVEHESHVIDDFHAGGDHETLSDTLAVGDVFVVKADDEEMEYWLL